jgi:molybdopterin converting factor small subunit
MNVTVKFCAYKHLAGRSESVVELPAGATVADLISLLAAEYPALFPLAERAVYLVAQRIAAHDTPLNDGETVLMLQMLGGG